MKYRGPDQKVTMHRLDPVLQELDAEISASATEGKATDKALVAEVQQREKQLSSLYTQVTTRIMSLLSI